MSFFPLHRKQVEECKAFQELTPHEKIVYWYLQSQFNLNGEGWYEPDLKISIVTGMSKSKVQKARYKFKERGWIGYRPGFEAAGKNVATSYRYVKWAEPPEKDSGNSFVPMHRYTFEVMLEKIRRGVFTHNDVVAYVILYYWHKCHEKSAANNDGWWFITKKRLRELAGFRNVEKSIRNLYEKYHFAEGNCLFEYEDEWHRYTFTEFVWLADPSTNENNRKLQQSLWERIEEEYQELSELEQRKREAERRKREVHPEVTLDDLPEYWRATTGQRTAIRRSRQKEMLRKWAGMHGVGYVCEQMDRFILLRGKESFPEFEKYWTDQHPEVNSWRQKV